MEHRSTHGPRRLSLLVLALGAAGLGACGDDVVDPVDTPIPALEQVGDAFLRATVGDTLNGIIGVRVVDLRDGSPLPGREVTFTIVEGEGSIRYQTAGGRVIAGGVGAAISAPAGDGGQLALDYFVSTTAGFGTVVATMAAANDTLFFGVLGEAADLAVVLRSGNGQVGQPGEPLAFPIGVLAQDAFGNPVGGIDVAWSVRSGGGSVDPPETTTDAFGRASVVWTLGPDEGTQELDATVAGAATFGFSAVAR